MGAAYPKPIPTLTCAEALIEANDNPVARAIKIRTEGFLAQDVLLALVMLAMSAPW
jgi:hypothetical protein